LKNWSLTANPKPLVIRGARQVGKSTLVRLFCKDNGLELIEINLEKNKIREFDNDVSFSIKKVLSEIELIVDKVISSNTLIFLDEIQDQPKAFAQLRYFYEDAPGLRVVAAGSLLDVIINEAKFSMPVGRIEYYFLGPMTYREFLLAQNEEVALKQLESITHDVPVSVALHEKMIEQLKNYYFVGGMPEAVKVFVETKDRAKVRRVQQDLLQTYRDDIPKYTIGKQGLRVREVFDYVPAHVGNNKVKFTDISETNSQQVKDAIELLHRAQIILKVSHTSASGLPLSAGVNPSVMKLFFLDVGLYNASMGVQWSSLVHASEEELLLKGSMAEQFIAQHLNLLFP
jgi:predicted AAA+ superfamily ATPase